MCLLRLQDWLLSSIVSMLVVTGGIGEVMPAHILLGIWSEVESPGHKILATLGFTDEKSKELESFASESGFLDE